MKFSTKSTYGLIALADICLHSDENTKPVTITSVASRHNISKIYLEQIITLLRNNGIVKGSKGAQGGYVLMKEPRTLTVKEILFSLEGELLATDAVDGSTLDTTINDIVFAKLKSAIDETAERITLQDIIDGYQRQGNLMFYI